MRLSWEPFDLRTPHAFSIARLKAPPARRAVWVRITDADGVEGWGEAAPNVYYGETAETVEAVLARYAAAVSDAADGDLRRRRSRLKWMPPRTPRPFLPC